MLSYIHACILSTYRRMWLIFLKTYGIPSDTDILPVSERSPIFAAKSFIDEKFKTKKSDVWHGYSVVVKRTNLEYFCTRQKYQPTYIQILALQISPGIWTTEGFYPVGSSTLTKYLFEISKRSWTAGYGSDTCHNVVWTDQIYRLMFSVTSARYFLYREPTNMRKSFDGLSGLVSGGLEQNVMSGDIYIFINKTHNRIKLLLWESGGFVVLWFCGFLQTPWARHFWTSAL